MALTFRNLTVTPQDPVEEWGFEGLLATVERGDINDWRRIAQAILEDPHGKVAQELDDVAAAAENPAIPSLLQRIRRQALTGKTTRKPEKRDRKQCLNSPHKGSLTRGNNQTYSPASAAIPVVSDL